MIRRIYNFNTIFVPVLFMLSAIARLMERRYQPRNKQLLRSSIAFIVIALMAGGFRMYATHIEPYRLVLREVTIETEKVSRPLRILHITDIQSAGVGSYEKKAFARMRELKPDIVIHTGDLLQPIPPATISTELPKIAALFRTLTPPLGTYGVIGDVDWGIKNASTDALGGINILNNNEALVETDGTRLRIFGVPCQASRGRTNATETIKDWFQKTDPSDFTMVIGHGPDYVLPMLDLPVDLCLAGHTHGGQIRIPFIGPIVTLSEVPRSWARGFRKVGRTRLNVSAGVGSEHMEKMPSMRFACPSEMTLITLVPKKTEEH
ncbi:metallophosphoesterase [Verrucomicrobiota bacterium]